MSRPHVIVLTLAIALMGAGCADDDPGDTTAPPTAEVAPQASTTTPAPTTAAPAPVTSPAPLDSVSVSVRTVATVESPTALAPRTGSPDLYVTERAGTVRRLVREGDLFTVDATPVLDLEDEVADLEGERGLPGLAFSPDGGSLYVSYTDGDDDGASVIARYPMAGGAEGETADPAGRTELLRLPQPYANHNGGNIVFGPDGYLWAGYGDGGSQGDPDDRGQDTSDLLGKMLRLDVSADGPYRLPPDNPFVGTESARGEIWAYGVRNPWRFSFDRANGDLWIADVGGAEWEEVDHLPAASGTGRGANLGWSLREGAHDTDKGGSRDGMVDPVFEYSHDEGSSISGGFVYRGAAVPDLTGAYLFSDFAAATLRGLRVDGDGRLAEQAVLRTTGDDLSQVVSFGQDNDGELYVLNLSGEILRIGPA